MQVDGPWHYAINHSERTLGETAALALLLLWNTPVC